MRGLKLTRRGETMRDLLIGALFGLPFVISFSAYFVATR